jgi:hypothetical protein
LSKYKIPCSDCLDYKIPLKGSTTQLLAFSA